MVAGQFGATGPNLAGDINKDNLINIFDLVLIANNFGQTLSGAPNQIKLALTNQQTNRLSKVIKQLQNKIDLSVIEASILELLIPFVKQQTPDVTKLLTNYPNPFNPETWIPFQLSNNSIVTITIYSIEGYLVRQFNLGQKLAGRYLSQKQAVYWNGKSQTGETMGSGTYFYQLQAGDYIEVRKMLILK